MYSSALRAETYRAVGVWLSYLCCRVGRGSYGTVFAENETVLCTYAYDSIITGYTYSQEGFSITADTAVENGPAMRHQSSQNHLSGAHSYVVETCDL